MKLEATPERIAKLPKWAQDHIRDLEQRRVAASDALTRYVEGNQEGPIVIKDIVCDEGARFLEHHVNGEKVSIRHSGVWLDVNCYNPDRVELQWGGGKGLSSLRDVAFIPTSYQSARLVSQENLR